MSQNQHLQTTETKTDALEDFMDMLPKAQSNGLVLSTLWPVL